MADEPTKVTPAEIKKMTAEAKRGDMLAIKALGGVFETGATATGVDFQSAFYWYQKAAEKGDGSAQFRVAVMYTQGGNNFPKNRAQALIWAGRAAKNGVDEGQRLVEFLEQNPTAGLPGASKESFARLYPGFHVVPGDFDSETIRVNSDGMRVDLSKWKFDNNTGEFYKIKKKVGNKVIFLRETYNERFTKYHSRASTVKGGAIVGVILIVVGLGIFASGFPVISGVMGTLVALGGAALLFPLLDLDKSKIGPEPLKRKVEDFGPSAATAPASHPAQDDLTYKPTSDGLGYTPST